MWFEVKWYDGHNCWVKSMYVLGRVRLKILKWWYADMLMGAFNMTKTVRSEAIGEGLYIFLQGGQEWYQNLMIMGLKK